MNIVMVQLDHFMRKDLKPGDKQICTYSLLEFCMLYEIILLIIIMFFHL